MMDQKELLDRLRKIADGVEAYSRRDTQRQLETLINELTEEQPGDWLDGQLQRLDLKPGDRCVLMTARVLSMDQVERLSAMWRGFFVGDEVPRLLILDQDTRLGVLGVDDQQEFGG